MGGRGVGYGEWRDISWVRSDAGVVLAFEGVKVSISLQDLSESFAGVCGQVWLGWERYCSALVLCYCKWSASLGQQMFASKWTEIQGNKCGQEGLVLKA